MTNEQHNKFVGYAFLAHGGFQVLMGLLFGLMFGSFIALIPSQPHGPEPPRAFFFLIMSFVIVIQSLFALPSFIAAYAVLKRKSWARIMGIIAAVLSAMSVPVGTAACVYALWFFFGENWKEVYEPAINQGGARTQLSGAGETATWTVNQGRDASRTYAPPPPPDWR
jgi:hypothetical protein